MDLPIKYSSNEDRTGKFSNLTAETEATEIPPTG